MDVDRAIVAFQHDAHPAIENLAVEGRAAGDEEGNFDRGLGVDEGCGSKMSTLDPILAHVGAPGPGVLEASALLQHLEQQLGRRGGPKVLRLVLDGFERQGLAHLAASWVSTAPNLAVTPAQVGQGLGEAVLGQLAHTVWLTPPACAAALALLLPCVIDRLTPSGEMSRASDALQPLVARTPAAKA